MRHYLYLFLLFIGLSISLTSCHGVMPDADEEAVLINKPWFFGHGGVEEEPVTTGCTWCWWSTSSEYFKIIPISYYETLDDIISNENTPHCSHLCRQGKQQAYPRQGSWHPLFYMAIPMICALGTKMVTYTIYVLTT